MADDEAQDRLLTVAGPGPAASAYADLTGELRRFVLGVVRDRDLADDVMQGTYVKALQHGHEVRPEKVRGWLFRVAFREALALRRGRATRDRGLLRLFGRPANSDAAADHGLIREETIASVRAALGRLSREQRSVVQARIYDEKTFAEIARESGLPLGTVLTRMRRALEKLRSTMNPGG